MTEPKNDRDQPSTYLHHTHSELGGRFATTGHETITGIASPAPPPLPPTSPWAGPDPVPDEPSLGYAIDAMPELALPPAQAPNSAPDSGAPSVTHPDVERSGAELGLHPSGDDPVTTLAGGVPPASRMAGSPPPSNKRS
jgi:hypothetical protein